MGFKEGLRSEMGKIAGGAWAEREGRAVPSDSSVSMGNDAVKIDATVLYADLADSTILVDRYKPQFAAKIYKMFLHCAAKIIVANGGTITAYDGDRVMAIYLGDAKNSQATTTALQLKWTVDAIVQPALVERYGATEFKLKHVVGIDTSELFVAKTGVRGDNDLVWVGRAANHAAKLAAMADSHQTYVSQAVFERLRPDVKTCDGHPMWESLAWNEFDGRKIFRSNWGYELD
jgi:class 3 adenylate cyclase